MTELLILFVLSVIHEVLCVAYTLSIAERRPKMAAILSGTISALLLTIFVKIASAEYKVAGVVIIAVAHALGAYATTRWMPRGLR